MSAVGFNVYLHIYMVIFGGNFVIKHRKPLQRYKSEVTYTETQLGDSNSNSAVQDPHFAHYHEKKGELFTDPTLILQTLGIETHITVPVEVWSRIYQEKFTYVKIYWGGV